MSNRQLTDFEQKVIQFQNDAEIDADREKEKNFYLVTEKVYPEIHEDSKSIWEDYRDGYYFYKEKYEAIRDATFWRMTKPLRNFTDWIRWIKTGQKRELHPKEFSRPISLASSESRGSIAVHVHLYYSDLLEEFCGYLDRIPETFDLFISCRQDADIPSIKKRAEQISHIGKVIIRRTPNRGRDIAPFYVLFGRELSQYEILLHIHTKKSLYTGEEKSDWRQWALNGVLKDEHSVKETLSLLRSSNANAGLVFGEMTPTLPLMALHWLYNGGRGKEILQQLHIKFENHMLFYPVGSFFWVKTKAIRPLFDMGMTYESFDEEKGQIDGTLAHALERIIACVVHARNYNMYIFDPETNHFSRNKSYKCFQQYFSLSVQSLGDLLIRDYDVITFDIFDTLITRIIYEPDDLFRLMEGIITKKYKKSVDYLSLRKKAEELAWQEHGDFCNIHNIYQKLPEISFFTAAEAQELKELEINLELELCIPRKDVLKIFNRLKDAGKKIIFISDMYLTSEIIAKMLSKCGYYGYTDLWISCEKGKRKDRDTIWDDFFESYGSYRTIHLGDNPHSDFQIVGDKKRASFLLLSSVEQFRFSDQFEKFKRFLDGSPDNSLIIGYLVNKCLYNSPFALKSNGISQLHDLEDVVEGLFSPLLLKFMDFLHNTSREDSVLLFLSREGYFLQKLYKHYCCVFAKKELKNFYFLTSRRATSVPQIASYKDAKDLLSTEYSGSLSTLLEERFGLSKINLGKDINIQLPSEAYKVITTLGDYAEQILKTASHENRLYLDYMKQLLGTNFDWNKATLIDVGYSGTIQYYLMKILHRQLDGCYLATAYFMKPDALDGTYRGLYSFWKSKTFEKTQLFLEAITAAPHGQVINFYKEADHVKAHMKQEDPIYGENAKEMQKFVYGYFEKIQRCSNGYMLHINKELAEAIFFEILCPGILGKECSGLFKVNDGYCMDGSWIYDEAASDWKLQKKGEELYLSSIRKQ